MFAPSKWRGDRIATSETTFPGLHQCPIQQILAGWTVAVVIGLAALAALAL
jgi:hypothetical protein